jgi:Putative peptidoglycan binding domain
MSETRDSTSSTAPFIRRARAPAHGGVTEALARSHINPLGLCAVDATTAKADITSGFDITSRSGRPKRARRDIVDDTWSATVRERLPGSARDDRRRNPVRASMFWASSARITADCQTRCNDAGAALSALIGVASTSIRGGAHKTLSRLADTVSSLPPPGAPAIACWLGTATFLALPLLPGPAVPHGVVVTPAETPQTATFDQAASSEIAMSLPEDKPPTGTAHQFNRMNLRYCIYQQIRLEAIGPVTYSTEADVFAALIKDWNSRCSRFHHAAVDKEAIDSEVKVRRSVLEAEGRALVRGWQRKIETSLQRLPTPESATAVATSASPRPETSDPLPPIIMLGRNPRSEISGGFNPLLKSPSLVLLRPDSAMRMQERLNELGYTIKPADGNWGPTSRIALRHFKEANGLLANDGFDVETAVRLFSASAARAVATNAGSAGDATGTLESAYPAPPGASLNPLNRADAERIQRRLAALGYYGGKIFGLWGVTSRKALRAFKAANDLADDDEWDAITETVLNDEQANRVAVAGVDGIGAAGSTSAAGAVKPDPTRPAAVPKPAKRTLLSPDDAGKPSVTVPAARPPAR